MKDAIFINIKNQAMRVLRLAVSLIGASLLFSILPLARNMFHTENSKDKLNKSRSPVIMQHVVKEEERPVKQVQKVRKMNKSSLGKNMARGMEFSMRFTPDLSVGSNGGGVNVGGNGVGDAVYDESDVDEQARPVSRMGIDYPRRAKEAGIEGTVSLVLVIGRDGNVMDVKVESVPSPLFIKPVEQAVRRWKFIPAKYQGVAVQVRMRQNITFSLES